jgi:thiol-disulfide isomerase/thioredoxin
MGAELDRQLARLQSGQYAIVAFSVSEGCSPCDIFRPQFEEQVRDARGQYLFIKYDSWDQPARFEEYLIDENDVVSIPVVVLVDYWGAIHRIHNIDNIVREIGYHALNSEQRRVLALRGLESDNPELYLEGLRHANYLLERGEFDLPYNNEELLELAADLRSNFLGEDDGLASVSISVFWHIYRQLEPGTTNLVEYIHGAGLMSRIVSIDNHYESDSRRMYEANSFFEFLDDEYIQNRLSLLDDFIDNAPPEVRVNLSWVYSHLVNQLSSLSARRRIRGMRRGFDAENPDALATRLLIYSRFDPERISVIGAHRQAPMIRGFMRHPDQDVREAAAMAYANVMGRVRDENEEENRLGVRALIGFLEGNRNASNEAMVAVFNRLRDLTLVCDFSSRDILVMTGNLAIFIDREGLRWTDQLASLEVLINCMLMLEMYTSESPNPALAVLRRLMWTVQRNMQPLYDAAQRYRNSFSESIRDSIDQRFVVAYSELINCYSRVLLDTDRITSPEEVERVTSDLRLAYGVVLNAEEYRQVNEGFEPVNIEQLLTVYTSLLARFPDSPIVSEERALGINELLDQMRSVNETTEEPVVQAYVHLVLQLEEDQLRECLRNLISRVNQPGDNRVFQLALERLGGTLGEERLRSLTEDDSDE